MFAALILAVEEHVGEIEAKNPILPEGKEIVWAVISFAIVFGLLAWKAWPAIKKQLKAREDRIRGDLERAEQARVEAESSLEEYRKQLAEARGEATKIIEEARLAAEQVRQERIAAIDDEIAEHRARARRRTSVSRRSVRWASCRVAWPSCRSSWPRRSSSTTSIATRRSNSSRTTSTR